MANAIHTIWNAWNEEPLELPCPEGWRIANYHLPERRALGLPALRATVENALNAETTSARLSSAASACILVDDITRPTPWTEVFEILLQALNTRGLPDDSITILVTLAGHAPMDHQELAAKIGAETLRRVRVAQHEPDRCAWTEIEVAGKPLPLNRLYMDADFKLALGTLIPHPFAGFSGGGKAVMPGVAQLDAIKRNHFLVAFGRGKCFDTDNVIRKQMDDAAQLSGLDVLINAVSNARREIVGLHAGPLRETYAAAVAEAQPYCATRLEEPHDAIVLNPYPKDQELLQVANAFNVINTLPPEAKQRLKAVVMLAHLGKGVGFHALFGPGGLLYKDPVPLRFLEGRGLIFFAPTLDESSLRRVFCADYPLASDWSDVTAWLGEHCGAAPSVGVFHQAAMQTANG